MPETLKNKAIANKCAVQLRNMGWKPYLHVFDADGQTCELISFPFDEGKQTLVHVRMIPEQAFSMVVRPCEDFWTVLSDSAVVNRRTFIREENLCIIRAFHKSEAEDDVFFVGGVLGNHTWIAVAQRSGLMTGFENLGTRLGDEDEQKIRCHVSLVMQSYRNSERTANNASAVEIIDGMGRKMSDDFNQHKERLEIDKIDEAG